MRGRVKGKGLRAKGKGQKEKGGGALPQKQAKVFSWKRNTLLEGA
jgi:hypothetical protein